MSNSANDIAKAASSVTGEWPVALASTLLLVVPSIFSAIGVYAIVEANTDLLRYEAAVLTSQGVNRSTLMRVWLVLLAAIPAIAYVLGLVSFLQFSVPRTDPGSLAIAAPILSTSLTLLTLTYVKITSVLNSAPFRTLRQP
jgi:ABC-type antimicrobial peptide transport system permease subunit